MTASAETRVVAVVGGGAAGMMTAIQLLTSEAAATAPVNVLLFCSGGEAALGGLAYSAKTVPEGSYLNTPADGLTAYPDKPGDLRRYLREQGLPCGAEASVLRSTLKGYLRAELVKASDTAKLNGGSLTVVDAAVGNITETTRRDSAWQLTLSGQARDEQVVNTWTVNAVVAATGHRPRGVPAFASGASRSPWLRADPYDADVSKAPEELARHARETGLPPMVIGTGPAGIDAVTQLLRALDAEVDLAAAEHAALSASSGGLSWEEPMQWWPRVDVVSRSGLLPARYDPIAGRQLAELREMTDEFGTLQAAMPTDLVGLGAANKILERIEAWQEANPHLDPQRVREKYLVDNTDNFARLQALPKGWFGGNPGLEWRIALRDRRLTARRVGVVADAIDPIVDALKGPNAGARLWRGEVRSIQRVNSGDSKSEYLRVQTRNSPTAGTASQLRTVRDVSSVWVCTPNPNNHQTQSSRRSQDLLPNLGNVGRAQFDSRGKVELDDGLRFAIRGPYGGSPPAPIWGVGVLAEAKTAEAGAIGPFRVNLYACATTAEIAAHNVHLHLSGASPKTQWTLASRENPEILVAPDPAPKRRGKGRGGRARLHSEAGADSQLGPRKAGRPSKPASSASSAS